MSVQSKEIRAGVIGLGVGRKHLDALMKHSKSEVVAACDLEVNKLDDVKQSYPSIFVGHDPREILENEEINFVSIASYDEYHVTQTVEAIRRGKHVFIENQFV